MQSDILVSNSSFHGILKMVILYKCITSHREIQKMQTTHDVARAYFDFFCLLLLIFIKCDNSIISINEINVTQDEQCNQKNYRIKHISFKPGNHFWRNNIQRK